MKQFTQRTTYVLALLLVSATALFAWAWHGVHAAIKKGLAQSESIRVVEHNACTMSETESDTPHFSGCNSIL